MITPHINKPIIIIRVNILLKIFIAILLLPYATILVSSSDIFLLLTRVIPHHINKPITIISVNILLKTFILQVFISIYIILLLLLIIVLLPIYILKQC